MNDAAVQTLRELLPGAQFAEFIAEAVSDIVARAARLRATVDAGDTATAAREAHDMVSVAGNCGASVLSAIAREIEQACRGGDIATARTRIEAFERATAASIEQLKVLLVA